MATLGLVQKDGPSLARAAMGAAFPPALGPCLDPLLPGACSEERPTSSRSAVHTPCPRTGHGDEMSDQGSRPAGLSQAWVEAEPQTWAGPTAVVRAPSSMGVQYLSINISVCDSLVFHPLGRSR